MASIEEHTYQVKRNLDFVGVIDNSGYWDWQVTVCFYTAVHLVNAHLSKFDLHYQTHSDVRSALNPYVLSSVTKVPEDIYTACENLSRLSRRSRYLISDKPNNDPRKGHLTYDKHFAKAIRHLDKLITYFDCKYSLAIEPRKVVCQEIKSNELLQYFTR
jgi:hypothetical protein